MAWCTKINWHNFYSFCWPAKIKSCIQTNRKQQNRKRFTVKFYGKLHFSIDDMPTSEKWVLHRTTHKHTKPNKKFPQKRQRNKSNARLIFGIRVKCLSCFGVDPLRLHATETKEEKKNTNCMASAVSKSQNKPKYITCTHINTSVVYHTPDRQRCELKMMTGIAVRSLVYLFTCNADTKSNVVSFFSFYQVYFI